MTAQILKGSEIAFKVKPDLIKWSQRLNKMNRKPHLVAVQVGQSGASQIYTNMQARACAEVEIGYELLQLDEDTTFEQLRDQIYQLNNNEAVTGIILQMPLPEQINAKDVQILIAPEKDVEGMHPQNLGRLFYGKHFVAPCTALAAVELIKLACNADIAGKEAVVIGHSEIVGKPIATLLLQSKTNVPTVTVCHAATRDLAFHTKRADIVVVAAGVSQGKWMRYKHSLRNGEPAQAPDLSPLISADMIKEGSVVIDVAINRIPAGFDEAGLPIKNANGKNKMITVGDVDFENAKEKAAVITPVPGGVGPLTVAMLLKNTLICAEAQI